MKKSASRLVFQEVQIMKLRFCGMFASVHTRRGSTTVRIQIFLSSPWSQPSFHRTSINCRCAGSLLHALQYLLLTLDSIECIWEIASLSPMTSLFTFVTQFLIFQSDTTILGFGSGQRLALSRQSSPSPQKLSPGSHLICNQVDTADSEPATEPSSPLRHFQVDRNSPIPRPAMIYYPVSPTKTSIEAVSPQPASSPARAGLRSKESPIAPPSLLSRQDSAFNQDSGQMMSVSGLPTLNSSSCETTPVTNISRQIPRVRQVRSSSTPSPLRLSLSHALRISSSHLPEVPENVKYTDL